MLQIVLVFLIDVVLMVFSIGAALLAQHGLAAMAGTACVGLSTKLARHLLR